MVHGVGRHAVCWHVAAFGGELGADPVGYGAVLHVHSEERVGPGAILADLFVSRVLSRVRAWADVQALRRGGTWDGVPSGVSDPGVLCGCERGVGLCDAMATVGDHHRRNMG